MRVKRAIVEPGVKHGTMSRRAMALAVAVGTIAGSCGITASAGAEPTDWRQVASGGPSLRSAMATVYDSVNHRTLLFGGEDDANNPNVKLNDTWAWDGSSWQQLHPATSPPGRDWAGMAFDPTRGVTVLFGGEGTPQGAGGSPALGDTWEFDGVTWTQITPPVSPAARISPSMVWDAGLGRIVLFGGQATYPSNDTWTYAGGAWAQVQTTTSPPPRTLQSAAYDPAHDRVVVFGGWGELSSTPGAVQQLGDTWLFDGGSWVQAQPPGPPARFEASMTYDAALGRAILWGGAQTVNGQTNGTGFNDTWAWDGAAWSQLSLAHAPAPGTTEALSFDSGRGVDVLFGGESNPRTTWELGATGPAVTVLSVPGLTENRVPQGSLVARITGGTAPYSVSVDYGELGFVDHYTSNDGSVPDLFAYSEEGSYTATVTVTDSVGMTVSGSAVETVTDAPFTLSPASPIQAAEGQAWNGTVAGVLCCPDAGDYSVLVNWGDGSTSAGEPVGASFVAGHTWNEGGHYTVTITASDDGGAPAQTASLVADVSDQPITSSSSGPVTVSLNPAPKLFGNLASVSDPDTTDPASTYTVRVYWGDGSNSAGYLVGSGGSFQARDSHAYALPGIYTVKVFVWDGGGSETESSSTAVVLGA